MVDKGIHLFLVQELVVVLANMLGCLSKDLVHISLGVEESPKLPCPCPRPGPFLTGRHRWVLRPCHVPFCLLESAAGARSTTSNLRDAQLSRTMFRPFPPDHSRMPYPVAPTASGGSQIPQRFEDVLLGHCLLDGVFGG